MFIVIEGVDAVGKTTACERLAKKVSHELKRAIHSIAFPRYNTQLGCTILAWLKDGRALEYPLAFQAMMSADKIDAATMLEVYMQRGSDIVCSRYWQSAHAYGVPSGSVPPEILADFHKPLPQANYNILLDMPIDEALARRPDKRDAYEKNPGYLEKVRQEYLNLWTAEHKKSEHWSVVDASKSADEVFNHIWAEIFLSAI